VETRNIQRNDEQERDEEESERKNILKIKKFNVKAPNNPIKPRSRLVPLRVIIAWPLK
jgi:hypothetical protein